MPIDLDRVRAVIQDWIGGNYDHIIDGPARAMTEFNGVRRPYSMFRLALTVPSLADVTDAQTLIDGAVEGAVARWFAGISQPDDTLVVFRIQPTVELMSTYRDAEGVGERIDFVHIRFRCHTMKVLDAIERGVRQEGEISSGAMGYSIERNEVGAGRNAMADLAENLVRAQPMRGFPGTDESMRLQSASHPVAGQPAYLWSDGSYRTVPELERASPTQAIIERESHDTTRGPEVASPGSGRRQAPAGEPVRESQVGSAPRIRQPAIRTSGVGRIDDP